MTINTGNFLNPIVSGLVPGFGVTNAITKAAVEAHKASDQSPSSQTPPGEQSIKDNPLLKQRLEQQSVEAPEKSGLQKVAGAISERTWIVPGASNILQGISQSDGSVGGVLGGAIKGFNKTVDDGLGTSASGAVQGNIGTVVKGYLEAVANNDHTPPVVKEFVGKIIGWFK